MVRRRFHGVVALSQTVPKCWCTSSSAIISSAGVKGSIEPGLRKPSYGLLLLNDPPNDDIVLLSSSSDTLVASVSRVATMKSFNRY